MSTKAKDGAPYISIVLVCYNYAHLLLRALEPMARQTFTDFEVVFVDNGCLDNSLEVAETFFGAHPEISVQYVKIEKNIGPAYGDNCGAAAAKGKYLMFHDADDWMDDNCLELLAKEAERVDADRVIAAFRDVDDNGKVQQVQGISDYPNKYVYGMQQANLFRRSLYVEKGMQTVDSVFLDAIKTLVFSAYAKNIGYVRECCYNYLVHLDSTSRNKKIHTDMWTNPRKKFETILQEASRAYRGIDDPEEKLRMEQQVVKLYIGYIYIFFRAAPLSETVLGYRKLNRLMLDYFPDYRKNPYITLSKTSGNRLYARIISWVTLTVERMHLMPLWLTVYHLMSKVYYFKV